MASQELTVFEEKKDYPMQVLSSGPGRDRTCDLGIKSPAGGAAFLRSRVRGDVDTASHLLRPAARRTAVANPRGRSHRRSMREFVDARTDCGMRRPREGRRSEEHTSELQSHSDLVCRLLLEKKKTTSIKKKQTTKQKTYQK